MYCLDAWFKVIGVDKETGLVQASGAMADMYSDDEWAAWVELSMWLAEDRWWWEQHLSYEEGQRKHSQRKSRERKDGTRQKRLIAKEKNKKPRPCFLTPTRPPTCSTATRPPTCSTATSSASTVRKARPPAMPPPSSLLRSAEPVREPFVVPPISLAVLPPMDWQGMFPVVDFGEL